MERLTLDELHASLFVRACLANHSAMTAFACSATTPLWQEHVRQYYTYAKLICLSCHSVHSVTSNYLFSAVCSHCVLLGGPAAERDNLGRFVDMCNWTAYKLTASHHEALTTILDAYGGTNEPI